MRSIVSKVSKLRFSLAQRRNARRQQLQLEGELSSYDTPSGRVELDAMLARHTAAEIAEVEHILNRLAVAGRRPR